MCAQWDTTEPPRGRWIICWRRDQHLMNLGTAKQVVKAARRRARELSEKTGDQVTLQIEWYRTPDGFIAPTVEMFEKGRRRLKSVAP